MKSKLSKIVIIAMFIMMSLMASGKSFAVELTEKKIGYNDIADGTQIVLEDLESTNYWFLLCNQHGGPLPGYNRINQLSKVESFQNHEVNDFILSKDQLDSALRNETGSTSVYQGTYWQTMAPAYTAIARNNICKPIQGYILSEMQEGINSYGKPNEYHRIQTAWYAATQGVGVSGDNSLYNVAKEYDEFVRKIARDVDDTSKYGDWTHKFGNEEVTVKFPNLKGDKSELCSLEKENVNVYYNKDTKKYIVGPMSLKYEECIADGVELAGINGFKIYTDADSKAVPDTKWRFIRGNTADKERKFPAPQETFYIEMDYIENATQINKIDIDYRFLVAGGEYTTLGGNYTQFQWDVQRTSKEVTNNDGSKKTVYNYKLVAKGQGISKASQELVLANWAARWYENVSVSVIGKGKNQADLIIKKIALDENGKEISAEEVKEICGEYQYFDFEVKIKYDDGREINKIVTVRAGDELKVGTYRWKEGEKAPTYEVKEVKPSKDNKWEYVDITDNYKGQFVAGQTIRTVIAKNKLKPAPNKGYIQIKKTIRGEAEKDETFEFTIQVDGYEAKKEKIIVHKGESTASSGKIGPFEWYGKEGPHYEIIEEPTPDSEKYNSTILPQEGQLQADKTSGAEVTLPVGVLNYPKGEKQGSLIIEKALKDGQVTDETFTFQVHVEGVKNTTNGIMDFPVTIKAGEKSGPHIFVWGNDDPAPIVTVTEKDNDEVKNVRIDDITGTDEIIEKSEKSVKFRIKESEDLEKATNVSVKFTNTMEKHKGKIKVKKEFFSSEKMTAEQLKILAEENKIKFDVEVVIKGTFEYDGKKYGGENSTAVINKTLSAESEDNKWEFTIDGITWYGSEPPTYTVRETSKPGEKWEWECVGTNWSNKENDSTDTEGHELTDGGTDVVTITNTIPSDEVIDLTFQMAGIVWVDEALEDKEGKDTYAGSINGVYDEGELLKENAEVTVYRVVYNEKREIISREPATAYLDKENNPVTFPIITKSDGKWQVPRISVPELSEEERKKGYTADYDVEFVYDGQTYEPTEFLSYKVSKEEKEGYDKTGAGKKGYRKEVYVQKNKGDIATKAKAYKDAKSKSERAEFENDSMAIEKENNAKKITAVSGKTPINANGDTTGFATVDGKQTEITYSSNDAGDGYPTHSRLNTTDENGKVLDTFKAKATTATGNLTFPFNYNNYDKLSLTKTETTFNVEDGFVTQSKYFAVYNYCLHINLGLKQREEVDIGLTKNLIDAKVVVNEKMYQYQYSGYYDLTEVKQDSLEKNIVTDIKVKNTERTPFTLGLYRSDYYYRAAMYNGKVENSEENVYGKLQGFYQSHFGGEKGAEETELDIYLTYRLKLMNGSSAYDVKINSIDDYYDSSFELVEGKEEKYLKTQTVAGEQKPVNDWVIVAQPDKNWKWEWKTTEENIVGSDRNADRKNIVYNKMTANTDITLKAGESQEYDVTFKVKKAPDDEFGIEESIILGQKCNVAEIGSYTTFYKDTKTNAGRIDRDSAPGNVNIGALNEKAWYEDDTFAAPRIKLNLIEQTYDRNINGIVWEDDSNDADNGRTENPKYNQQIGNGVKDDGEVNVAGLTTELVQKVTVKNDNNNQYTEYDYIWPSDPLECLNGKTIKDVLGLEAKTKTDEHGNYNFSNVIAGDYVVRFTYGNERVESKASYSTAGFYNGQDFKSSQFKGSLESKENGLRADNYLKFNDYINKDETLNNTAVDSEVRRLEAIGKTREIDNEKSTTMMAVSKGEETEKCYMWADTPKIDMNIEPSINFSKKEGTKGNAEGNKGVESYHVNNINFGIEERPMTQLTLDKQIEEITLTTSDGKDIMYAKYNIEYKDENVDENGNIKAEVTLNAKESFGTDNLQALNRDSATNQGFRYINVDSSILNGTTITVKYKFTVLNTGEVDRTGKLAKMLYFEDTTKFEEACNGLSEALAKFERKEDGKLENTKALGEYLGSIYYYGSQKDVNKDEIVTSRVRQLVDYVDNDIEYNPLLNVSEDMSWSSVTVDELKEHIDKNIINKDKDGNAIEVKDETGATKEVIVDENGISYENNMLLSVDKATDDDEADNTESKINNGGFIVNLQPQNAAKETRTNWQASMYLTVSQLIGADSDDLQIDNITEIIRYNNKVGRRDELTIAGNTMPAKLKADISKNSGEPDLLNHKIIERDTSATEVITLSPPTGSSIMIWRLQVAASIIAGLAVIAGGIVFIKKKILK